MSTSYFFTELEGKILRGMEKNKRVIQRVVNNEGIGQGSIYHAINKIKNCTGLDARNPRDLSLLLAELDKFEEAKAKFYKQYPNSEGESTDEH